MKTLKVRKRQTGADHKQNPMLIKQLGHSDTEERIGSNTKIVILYIIFFPQKHPCHTQLGPYGQQIDFCLKWSKSVKMGPKGSQIVKNI